MAIQFEDHHEAFMALGLAVIAVDREFTAYETATLLKTFRSLNILSTQDDLEFELEWENIFNRTFNKLQAAFPCKVFELSNSQIDVLISTIKETVEVYRYESLYTLAFQVAIADGLHEREQVLLDRLQIIFGISPQFVARLKQDCNQNNGSDPQKPV